MGADDVDEGERVIIFGLKSMVKLLAMVNLVCRNCHNPAAQRVIQVTRWFSLFFIPVFPVGVSRSMTCTFCGITTKLSKQDAEHLQLSAQGGFPGGPGGPQQPAPPQSAPQPGWNQQPGNQQPGWNQQPGNQQPWNPQPGNPQPGWTQQPGHYPPPGQQPPSGGTWR